MTKSEAGKSCLGASDSLRTQGEEQFPTPIMTQMGVFFNYEQFVAEGLIFIKTNRGIFVLWMSP